MAWGWGRLTLIPDACILTVAISKSANQLRNSAVGLNGPAWRCEKLNAIDADINTACLFDGKPCCCCCCSCWCWIDDEAIWTISLIVASNVVLTTNFQLQISSIIGTVELCVCQASVRLSVPARAHSSKPPRCCKFATGGPVYTGRQEISIDCCTAHSSAGCGERMRVVPRCQRT